MPQSLAPSLLEQGSVQTKMLAPLEAVVQLAACLAFGSVGLHRRESIPLSLYMLAAGELCVPFVFEKEPCLFLIGKPCVIRLATGVSDFGNTESMFVAI